MTFGEKEIKLFNECLSPVGQGNLLSLLDVPSFDSL